MTKGSPFGSNSCRKTKNDVITTCCSFLSSRKMEVYTCAPSDLVHFGQLLKLQQNNISIMPPGYKKLAGGYSVNVWNMYSDARFKNSLSTLKLPIGTFHNHTFPAKAIIKVTLYQCKHSISELLHKPWFKWKCRVP